MNTNIPLVSLLLVLLVVILVFPLWPYETAFISAHEFPLLSISPPYPARGGREGASEWLSSA